MATNKKFFAPCKIHVQSEIVLLTSLLNLARGKKLFICGHTASLKTFIPLKFFLLEIIYFCCVVKPLQQAVTLILQGFKQ
jgi:hypothetical protein